METTEALIRANAAANEAASVGTGYKVLAIGGRRPGKTSLGGNDVCDPAKGGGNAGSVRDSEESARFSGPLANGIGGIPLGVSLANRMVRARLRAGYCLPLGVVKFVKYRLFAQGHEALLMALRRRFNVINREAKEDSASCACVPMVQTQPAVGEAGTATLVYAALYAAFRTKGFWLRNPLLHRSLRRNLVSRSLSLEAHQSLLACVLCSNTSGRNSVFVTAPLVASSIAATYCAGTLESR